MRAVNVERLVLNVFVGESDDRFISPHLQRLGKKPWRRREGAAAGVTLASVVLVKWAAEWVLQEVFLRRPSFRSLMRQLVNQRWGAGSQEELESWGSVVGRLAWGAGRLDLLE